MQVGWCFEVSSVSSPLRALPSFSAALSSTVSSPEEAQQFQFVTAICPLGWVCWRRVGEEGAAGRRRLAASWQAPSSNQVTPYGRVYCSRRQSRRQRCAAHPGRNLLMNRGLEGSGRIPASADSPNVKIFAPSEAQRIPEARTSAWPQTECSAARRLPGSGCQSRCRPWPRLVDTVRWKIYPGTDSPLPATQFRTRCTRSRQQ